MPSIITQILEMDLHELEDAEQDALLTLLRAGKSLLTRTQISQHTPKETVTLMAATEVTDDQVITQLFSLADTDQVPVDDAAFPVSVTVVDATGADVSKWINVAQDSANPLKFVYSRKADDGTQPQDLAFTSVGTATVNGAPTEFKSDFMFTPGAATSLTSLITVGAAAPVEPPVAQQQGEQQSA